MATTITRQGVFTPSAVDLDISAYKDESSPFSNAYGKDKDNTGSYAEWGLVTGSQANTHVCWRFDLSSIPSNATITNVKCEARCSNTNQSIAQGGNTLIAIGTTNGTAYVNKVDSGNQAFGTTAKVVTVSSADFTREELNNFRLKIQAVRGFMNTSRSYHTKFYGATLTIDYTVPVEVTTHTVRFLDWNGDVLDTQTVNSGSDAVPPNYPTRNGYLCIGWDNYNYTNISSNLDITAQYVQEQGTPSDNALPPFTTWNTFYDSTLVQATEHSIAISTPKGYGSVTYPYPEEWKDKDVTFTIGDISGGEFALPNDYTLYNENKSITINVPSGGSEHMAFYSNNNTGISWVSDVYATLPEETITHTVRFLDWNNDVLDTQTINDGGNATPPNDPVRDGYRFTGWSGSYTNITADTDITAQYIKTYNIVASAGTGGTISPSGTTTVDEGSSQTYTISANTGYGIKDVLVDDISQGEITSYTFTDVTANHTLSVIFKEIPRVIAAIKKNIFYANNIYEGYDNFAIGKDGVYLNAIYEDLNEDENIYLDKNGILHVYQFIEDVNYGIINPETDLIDFEYEENGGCVLTGWKETLNGEPSTEMIIPDNENIIL